MMRSAHVGQEVSQAPHDAEISLRPHAGTNITDICLDPQFFLILS